MLHATPFGRSRYWEQMHALVARFHGVEPDMAEKTAWMAKDGIPSVNWLTLVGEPHLTRLGGRDKLIDVASRNLSVVRAGHGVMIRAGERPRMGDTQRSSNSDLEPYRAAYAVLQPAMYVQGDFGFSDKHFGAERTLAWQRRFEKRSASDAKSDRSA